MAITVSLNTRVSTKILGTINQNLHFFDPLTGVNLNPKNPTSGDLSSFSNAQLANIASAVRQGTLTLNTGALPADPGTYNAYALFASAGKAGGQGWTGITGLDEAHY